MNRNIFHPAALAYEAAGYYIILDCIQFDYGIKYLLWTGSLV